VLDEIVGRLALIEHRFLADEDRGAFGKLVTDMYGQRAAKLGSSPAPNAGDEIRLRRAVLLRALVVTARDANAVAEADKRLPAAGSTGHGDPNLLRLAGAAVETRPAR